MRMQSTPPNFNGRIDINNLRTSRQISKEIKVKGDSALGSFATGLSSAATGTVASRTSGVASEIASTAFFSEASGVNSSGIVPASIKLAAPHVSPATVAVSNEHPSSIGTFFSAAGQFFSRITNIKINVKNPS